MTTRMEVSPAAEKRKSPQDMQEEGPRIPRRALHLCSLRGGLVFLMHVCNLLLVGQNTVMNITMVAMVNSTAQHAQLNSSPQGPPADSAGRSGKAPEGLPAEAPVYNWSPQTQGLIFSSINYGLMLTQAPSGYLAGRVGSKWVVAASLFGSSLLGLCTPLAADLGLPFLVGARIIQGLIQGLGLGGQFALWTRWSPPLEQSWFCSLSLSGVVLGPFVAILMGGLISQALGWPSAFYVFGGVGCAWCLLWLALVYDDPSAHPCISVSEKEYIASSLAQQVPVSRQPLPIKAMLGSRPLWALCVCCFSHQWLINLQLVYTPTYIRSVYGVSVRDNGVMSALPFITAWAVAMLSNSVPPAFLTRRCRLLTVRRVSTILGNLPPAVLVAALPFLDVSYITAVAALMLSCGLSSLCLLGIYVNTLDIAPRYSSFLMGFTRAVAAVSATLAPIASGLLLDQDPDSGWRNVFLLMLAINLLGLATYVVFGAVDVQDWAEEGTHTRL
ncbi:sodium-dependent phosphate transport protein 4 [Tupaia chinensis]|uniref:sodium-dependent phosphate transport protein 4 n=1 Tax=Tupaia chinensis TaxID=246437 RepID=UPI0003C91FBE|nr:sodium-dependent phosphate transport protein 4 [Tupaia chinensis]XP_027621841.1 sodium-dependent phosphate transport protein 4 [Tupaia chinensis]